MANKNEKRCVLYRHCPCIETTCALKLIFAIKFLTYVLGHFPVYFHHRGLGSVMIGHRKHN